MWFPIAFLVVFDTEFHSLPGGLPCPIWYRVTP